MLNMENYFKEISNQPELNNFKFIYIFNIKIDKSLCSKNLCDNKLEEIFKKFQYYIIQNIQEINGYIAPSVFLSFLTKKYKNGYSYIYGYIFCETEINNTFGIKKGIERLGCKLVLHLEINEEELNELPAKRQKQLQEDIQNYKIEVKVKQNVKKY